MHRGPGDHGTDYAKRAVITRYGYGANLDADALYPHATTNADGSLDVHVQHENPGPDAPAGFSFRPPRDPLQATNW